MVPALGDILASLRVVQLPLRTRFRGITVREAALFEGPSGWTEFSPFPEYADREASAWLAAAVEFGWQPAPRLLRDTVPVNATVPAVSADEVPGVLARFDGCRAVKVKVAEAGGELARDVARLAAVRRLAPDIELRVDANGAWGVDQAVTALTALAPFGLAYAEQPCRTVCELAQLRHRLRDAGVAVPIAADESIRRASDPLRVARAGAADLIIVKAQPLGGVRRAAAVVAETGLPAVVSSALDTSVGIAMGAHLAASLPQLAGPCGLGTVSLFTGDAVDRPLTAVGGQIPVVRPRVIRSGFEVARGSETHRWWRNRVTRCHALLAADGDRAQ